MLRIAITDGSLQRRTIQIGTASAQAELLARILPLAQGDAHAPAVDFVILRERDLPDDAAVHITQRIVDALAATSTRVLLAGPPALALQSSAHGAHLAASDDLAADRRVLPAGYLTISCHTLEQVHAARKAAASAILFAPVFGKFIDGTEVVPGVGLERLHQACRAGHPVPVIALGGITRENTPLVLDAGAAGIAAIRHFFPRLADSAT